MANGHNKRKRVPKKERYVSRAKKGKIVSPRREDGHGTVAAVDDGSRMVSGDNVLVVENGPTDQECVSDTTTEGRHIVDSSFENGPVDQECVSDTTTEGRRIVDSSFENGPADQECVSDTTTEGRRIVDSSFENGPADQESVSDTTIEGRRIVDISFFWQQLHEKFDNHNVKLACPFSELKLVNSFDRGLRTQLYFVCRKCSYKFNIWTDPDHQNILGINESAVCGTITSGTGHSTLQEMLAAMSIPCMSAPTYLKYREKLFDNFHEVAEAEMLQAAAMEREIAIKKGHVIDGVPYIEVIADGCWSKRSYAGGKYDALSGLATIFGRETKLALFAGVRNKYCATHTRAELLDKEPTPHVCYKNWGRNRSSNAMETDIILEGFRTSVESNGLIYRTLVADGDSSVYQAIRDANPYAEYGIIVQKIECNNHLFRNLCRKLRMASNMKLTTAPLKGTLSVTQFREYIFKSGLKIRKTVVKARDLRNTENISEAEKATQLCKDILNIFGHVFGDHTNCHTLPFDCTPEPNGKNVLAELHRTGIYPHVYEAVRYLSCHAKSLLKNVTNNVAEGCNSVVNKYNSGKRINHSQTGSDQMRCYGAVVQYTTQSVLSKLHIHRNHRVPTAVLKMERQRRNQNHLNRLSKLRKRNRRPRRFHGVDKDYGPSAEKPDIEDDVFDVLAEQHIDKLKSYQNNSVQIERDTVSQSDSELWHQLRTGIITASKFGPICRMMPTTSCANMVTSIRCPKMLDTAATQFGLENENNARRDLELKLGKEIVPCGLFIDQEIPYLGASPDGLIDDDGVVEIKCPYSAKNAELQRAIEEKPNLKNIFDKKDKTLMNKNHIYYYQVQGQLHVTNRAYCIFALWTSVDLKIVKVDRDDAFWNTKMQPFLCRFYMECLLPEIIDSRRSRNMRIRDPRYILEAKAKALRKKNARCIANSQSDENCITGSTKITRQTSEERIVTSVSSKDKANPSSKKNEDNAINDWVAIESDGEIEASNETLGLLEIVRRNVSVEEAEANVLSPNSLLTDSSIDLFQNILRENSGFCCNPASYTAYYSCIRPCSPRERDIQIIGGNVCRHWCCVYYDTCTLYIYDSLLRGEYERLSKEEQRYISKRYPHIDVENIVLQPVTRQPDSFSCGIYSAAYATTIALGDDPVRQTYSRDAKIMREHLMIILRSRRLTSFPCE